MSNTITPHPGAQSPFDAIRRVSEVGTEYWSARELMPLLGYGADWRNFAAVIEKATIAAANQGENPDRLFGGVTEKCAQGRISNATLPNSSKSASEGLNEPRWPA